MKILVLMLAIWSIARAQPGYIWPVKLTPDLSSRFCDHRNGHFHAGLDIRTNGRPGYRIYAIDDGYIYRLSTAHNGYGKALYLRLDDGKIVVYGHLSGFGEDLDELVRKKQMGDKKYYQNIFFDPGTYKVKKGQQIGFTGESGSGRPHLHFEIRTPDNLPVNPLNVGYFIEDSSPPVFDRLAVRYYDGEFSPGNPCEIEFPGIKGKGSEYYVTDTLICEGDIALAVSGGDKVNGKNFKFGFYGLRMFVDDSLYFVMSSDSISYETTGQIDYIRDLELYSIAAKKGSNDADEDIFFRLYVPPGATQFFYSGYGDNEGIIRPGKLPGIVRHIRIEAVDESGNKATMSLNVKTPELPPPPPDFISYYKFGDTLEIDFLTNEKISGVDTEYRDAIIDPYQQIASRYSTKTWKSGEEVAYLNNLKIINPYKREDYRFRYRAPEDRTSPWIYFEDAGNLSGIAVYGSPDKLRIDYYPDSIYTNLIAQIQTESITFDLRMNQKGVGLFSTEIVGQEIYGPASITIKRGAKVVADTVISIYPLYPGIQMDAYSPDSDLKIQFDRNSAFYPAYVQPSIAVTAEIMGKEASVFEIHPLHFIANSPIYYQFDLMRMGISPEYLGAYGYNEKNGKWGFIEKAKGPRIEFPGLGLGRIALIADDSPPDISVIRPSGRIKSRKPVLSCTIRDEISGVNIESGLEMKLDGIWIPAEYDFETRKFRYRVQNNLRAGRHKIEIFVLDNQGNKTEKTQHFTILGR